MYPNEYLFWKEGLVFDPETRKAVAALSEKEMLECFGSELEFGTGGLRGIMGVGPNRMNRYTVRKATAGLAAYLKKSGALSPTVVIAHDSRNHSRKFALETACTLCAAGIRVDLFREIAPTPMLSFAVRELHADAGVVITASHNPKEYNGYKVYGPDGCQAVPAITDRLIAEIQSVTDLSAVSTMPESEAREKGLLCDVPQSVCEAFVRAAVAQAANLTAEERKALRIVYTPLHGAGLIPVRNALGFLGYAVTVVPEQATMDGDFPTVRSPNPENPEALAMGIALAKKTNADIVLGTDPDSDRVGVAVRCGKDFRLLTGNQTGALLTDFLIRQGRHRNEHPVLIKTIVTNDLGAKIAAQNGIEVRETLTGFKFIGEQIGRMERDGSGQFFFGYEESYGYLIGTHARDKDAVVSSVVIAEMAAYWKARGKTLADTLNDLYATYGYYLDELDSFTFEGLAGMEKIRSLMERFRTKGKKIFPDVVEQIDYWKGINGLPKADVLKFRFRDGSWLAVRPSGTEPKIKFYDSVRAKNQADAKVNLRRFQGITKFFLENEKDS